MKKILITGGAGFIGSRTGIALAGKGSKVRLLDNLQYEPKREWPAFLRKRGMELMRGDVRRKADWRKALKGVDVVFHFAVHKTMDLGFSNFFAVNTVGTALMYETIVEDKLPVKRIVMGSSQAIYGDGFYECRHNGGSMVFHAELRPWDLLLKGEWNILCPHGHRADPIYFREDQKVGPTNSYALSKYAAEALALRLGRTYEIPTTVLRYSLVQGPGQSVRNPFADPLRIFVTQALANEPITVYEDGEQTRDFVNIDDVVAANQLVLNKANGCEIFNVGGGRGYRVLDLARMVREATRSSSDIITGSFRRTDVRHAVSDIAKLQDLGWKPKFSPEHSARSFLEWYLQSSRPRKKSSVRR